MMYRESSAMKYWLMKSEPNVYGIDDLYAEKNKTAEWDGVRSYQARNIMRDDMKNGDLVFFYHSNAKPSGVAGIMRVVRESYPDFTAFDHSEKYYDPKSDPDNPRWFMVDIQFIEKFANVISLADIKAVPDLSDMVLVNNPRLSVQPVEKKHYDIILGMAGA